MTSQNDRVKRLEQAQPADKDNLTVYEIGGAAWIPPAGGMTWGVLVDPDHKGARRIDAAELAALQRDCNVTVNSFDKWLVENDPKNAP